VARVRLDSYTNSTLFTTCCGVAICNDQDRCPACGEEVPYSSQERWEMGMRGLYGAAKYDEMRARWRAKR
jgi:hypothetical protein